MKNKNHLISIVLFLSLIFFISIVSAIQVPYDGLTLEWKGIYQFKNLDYPSVNSESNLNHLYIYSNLQNGKITQKSVDDDTEEVIDIESRELITGEYIGNKTSQWINTNVAIGDKIQILGTEYVVKSTSDKTYLRDFGNMETIKVEYTKTTDSFLIDSTEKYENEKINNFIWYDKTTGLKLKSKRTTTYDDVFTSEYLGESSYSKEKIYEYELKENNVDNDKDGITDLKELFEYQTNPLSVDSDSDGIDDKKEIEIGLNPLNKNTDGDWWVDGEDSDPQSKLKPLIYYIIGFIIILGLVGGIFWFKFSKKKIK